jgi:SAM-dependent methyltransferase
VILRCPSCNALLRLEFPTAITCDACLKNFGVSRGVVDFMGDTGTARSFGFQWSNFAKTQLDSSNLANRSKERFLAETGWNIGRLNGARILDAGCGSGRFAEIPLVSGGIVTAIDASIAVYAARENLSSFPKANFFRCDLLNLPFIDDSFDFVYCIGVLQHTANPDTVLSELSRVVKPGGELAITFYEKSGWWTSLYSKYVIRRFTKRISTEKLLWAIRGTAFLWFPISRRLFSLPGFLGKFFQFVIPVANYPNHEYLDIQAAKQEAILDTLDMLSPEFDNPLRKTWVIEKVTSNNFEVLDSSRKGNVVFRKRYLRIEADSKQISN